ncbi:MAG: prepilin-type N-terminal cleavage/methylation domain-containing protein [Actinomycetota bacterium]
MLTAIRKRLHQGREEGGFTLIELMVVVLIIAILIAIAIPTFLGARRRAQDRAAQSNARNAFTAEKTYYTDAQAYTATVADLTAIEPALLYAASDAVPAAVGTLGVSLVAGEVFLNVRSASGTCFYLRDNPTGTGTQYTRDAACGASSAVAGWASTPW